MGETEYQSMVEKELEILGDPLFSVCITSFERYNDLRRAITSVLNQSLKPFEIIVVDNGSKTEDYARLLEEFNDDRLTYIRLSSNTFKERAPIEISNKLHAPHTVDSCNVAMTMARGTWLAILHDDDEWMPEKLEKQANLIRRAPQCLIHGTNSYFRSPNGELWSMYPSPLPFTHGNLLDEGIRDVTECVFHFNPLVLSTVVLHHSLFKKVGFMGDWNDSAMGIEFKDRLYMDWDYLYRSIKYTRILSLDEPLVYYTMSRDKAKGLGWRY
jgi:glycosyltransferase involved in cell wall biosynthesis